MFLIQAFSRLIFNHSVLIKNITLLKSNQTTENFEQRSKIYLYFSSKENSSTKYCINSIKLSIFRLTTIPKIAKLTLGRGSHWEASPTTFQVFFQNNLFTEFAVSCALYDLIFHKQVKLIDVILIHYSKVLKIKQIKLNRILLLISYI